MQDRKALQAGTSHFLGQNFSKAQEIKFLSAEGREEFAWTTSLGRVDALDRRLDHDPRRRRWAGSAAAPGAAACRDPADLSQRRGARRACWNIARNCGPSWRRSAMTTSRCACMLDDRESPRADKKWQQIKRGVPVTRRNRPARFGRRHADAQAARRIGRRKEAGRAAQPVRRPRSARHWRRCSRKCSSGRWPSATANTRTITKLAEFEAFFTPNNADNPEIHGGFADLPLRRSARRPTEILARHKVTIRCMPVADEPGFERRSARQLHFHRRGDEPTGGVCQGVLMGCATFHPSRGLS